MLKGAPRPQLTLMWGASGIFATSQVKRLPYGSSVILAENRFPLVRIMLSSATALAYEFPNGHGCFGSRRPGASFRWRR